MAAVVVPCSYCKVEISDTVIQNLKTFLPSGFNHNICSFTPDSTSVEGFKAVISLPASTKEDMKLWKSEFEKKTLTTYRVEKKFKDGRKKVLYKEMFCCQHRATRRGKGIYISKKTGCKSTLIIGVLQVPEKYRGNNPHLPHLPGSASITWVHDHPIIAAAALRYRDVSETVTQRLLELFHSGCGPGEALKILQVEAENSPSFISQMGDRHFIPDYAHVWYLHKKSFEECYGRYTAPNLPIASQEQRLQVATGSRDVSEDWFAPLIKVEVAASADSESLVMDNVGGDATGVKSEDGQDVSETDGVTVKIERKEDDASTSMGEYGVSERTVVLEAQLAEFRSFCERAENMIRSDPETLLEPLTKYLKRGEDCIKTKTMFASALSTFGSACSTRRCGVKIK